MKFVKGDAIAGLVVLAVNVLGGLVIGVWQRGMDVADAARTFTVLTIGEGLVAQIPALLISTAAGIVVTRVASEEEGAHLGKEIAGQILGQPKAIAIAAALLAVLALVPGLPSVPFLVLAALLGLVARALLTKKSSQTAQPLAETGGDVAWARAARGSGPAPLLTAIAVELGSDASTRLCSDGDVDALAARLTDALGPPLFAELGISLPALRVRASAPDVASSGYVIRFNEVPLGQGDLMADGRDDEALVAAHVMTLLRRYGHEFVGIEETQALLDRLAQSHPALVREVVPKLISPTLLADVLRRLVEEGVSLRNLKDVLGALAEGSPQQKDPVTLTEHVRGALRRAITYRHTNGDGVLPVFLLDPMIEEAVREAIHKTATGSYLALEPQLSRDIVDAVGRTVTTVPTREGTAVILTNADIRRYVRRLVETEHPLLAVLAYPELAPEARLQTLGHIRVGLSTS